MTFVRERGKRCGAVAQEPDLAAAFARTVHRRTQNLVDAFSTRDLFINDLGSTRTVTDRTSCGG